MAAFYPPAGGRRFRSKLSAQEEEIITVSFDSFSEEFAEKDMDGKPTIARYITVDTMMEAFKSIDAIGDIHDVKLMVDDIDANSDGRIDSNEWRGIMTRKLLGEDDDSSAPHVFQVLDDNNDGYIPYVELRNLLMREGQAPLSEQEVDELAAFADPDADGLINYREFLRWLSNPQWVASKAAPKAKAVAAAKPGFFG
mmetsp:Transcript_55454/g.89673  ORF Transcript_55454/g.89673 Transcript_55454/m.89673 type:complete len:197 (-) Transcript_55454:35-625(-)|eukprot:CAMPEP_0115090688 /NCGR_PEP_ID=MMETSP0227-20121206/25593_1 /TAXON_ID=89957 /ORGANISM="Polarella glacialis, Strain CCMP 1383" /LENGTH=196 /DNA_ID=CAMNT_0002481911 /DNA_START=66 /DNA_END=656 /DNA_ORIENTATION=-